MDLKDKIVLLTGGARMGEQMASALAREGCHVVLTYRHSRQSAETSAQKVRSLRRQALVVKTDLTRHEAVSALMKKVRKILGRLDLLVNLASVYEGKAVEKLNPRDWDNQVDLKIAWQLSMEAFKLMKKQGGRIIHFTDWIAASGRPRYRGYAPYYTAKSGIIGLTQVLALEFAPRVLVNAIAPGPILPPTGSKSREIKAVAKSTPLGKWGSVSDISKTVLFLAQTDFITGECIRVDGGRHLY